MPRKTDSTIERTTDSKLFSIANRSDSAAYLMASAVFLFALGFALGYMVALR